MRYFRYSQTTSQHQQKQRSIHLVSNSGEEFFDLILTQPFRQRSSLLEVMTWFDWIDCELFLFDNKEIKEPLDGIQPPINGRGRQALTMLLLDKPIHFSPCGLAQWLLDMTEE
jgi:hypothetical protein